MGKIYKTDGMVIATEPANGNDFQLLHLSDGNANAKEFKDSIQEATQKTVSVATPGMKINFNKSPF